MRIFVIPSWYPPAGGEFFIDQTKWLMEYGIDATVITLEEKSLKTLSLKTLFTVFKHSYTEEFGIPTYRKKQLRIPKNYRVNTRIWIRQFFRLAETAIREQGKPDLIQVHSSLFGGSVAACLKEKYGIPYIITEHRGRFNENNSRAEVNLLPWFNPLIAEGLRNASWIIPVSRRLIPKLENIAGQKLNCTVIPNPVDEMLFVPDSRPLKSNDTTQFLSISAFMPVKALDKLLQAFAAAIQLQNSLNLHFVGDGTEYAKIVQLSHELKLKEHVTFHGYLSSEQVKKKISESDFLVMSSLTEGQPVSIAETLLCGKPVIATDVVSEEDVPSQVGYIIQTGNIEALKQAMLTAHSEKERFSEKEIRAFAKSRFSKSVVIPKIIELMNIVAHEK